MMVFRKLYKYFVTSLLNFPFPGHASIRKTLVEHRAKIARAKKPLVASSFLQGTCCPVSGYLAITARFILPYFHLFARSSGNHSIPSTYKSFIFQKKKKKKNHKKLCKLQRNTNIQRNIFHRQNFF